ASKAAWSLGLKGPDPCDRLPSERVNIGIVRDLKRNICAAFREHDAAPGAKIQERQGVGGAVPDLFHRPGSDGGKIILAGKSKPPLDFRMQTGEIRAQHLFID